MTRIRLVRAAILDERLTGWPGLPWAILIWGAALGLRLAIVPLVEGVPFLTFFPAVLVASVLLGWRWGVVVLLLSAVTANFAFQHPYYSPALGEKELASSVGFGLTGGLMIAVAETLRRSVIEISRAAARETELNLELNHRVNNNLAVVQSLAAQTLRTQMQPDAFASAFTARLLALSEANRVLSGSSWEASPLPRLAQSALKPFLGVGQISLEGPAAILPSASCVPLVLVLHELATNATKHGALSCDAGRVRLVWRVEAGVCRLVWTESGGPKVAPPRRVGLGSRLLRPQSGIDELTMEYAPDGVVCRLAVQGARLAETD